MIASRVSRCSSRDGIEAYRESSSEFVTTNCRAKTTPIVIGSANYRDPFILTRDRIDPVRSEDMISVSGSYLDATIHCVVENGRAKEVKRALRLRLIDILAFSGATAVVKRGKNRHSAEAAICSRYKPRTVALADDPATQ
jgi:hypothetical protein